MAKKVDQKLKILYLLKILCENSMKERKVTMPEILKELSERYGICAERKSIYSDIEGLRNFGIDIIGEKQGKAFKYYVRNLLHGETSNVISTTGKIVEEIKDLNVILELMVNNTGVA